MSFYFINKWKKSKLNCIIVWGDFMKLDENQLLVNLKQLFEVKDYKNCLKIIEENEDCITKKYYEIIPYKIECLIELNKLIDASVIIKEELSVPYIPPQFEKFLRQKKKEIEFILKDKQKNTISYEDIEMIDQVDEPTLVSMLANLKNFNLNNIKEQIQNVFSNTKISDLTKSLLIACLSDNKLNADFVVIKEEVMIKFNPSNVFDIRDSENLSYIQNELNKIKDIEINTLEIINRLVMTYLLNIYPLQIEEEDCDNLLVACVLLASSMMNNHIKNSKIEQIYLENRGKINKLCEKINNLLETI